MKNWLLIIFTLLTLSAIPQAGKAAFIVASGDAPTKTETIVHKPFAHRKIPVLINNVRKTISGEHVVRDHSKPGWPGVLSFVFALVAIAGFFMSSVALPVYLLGAICAIVFGGIGLNRKKYSNRGFAIAGLVLGILEVVALVLLVVLFFAAFSAL